MEHSCYRCGAKVEEGIAFCPHCNAPQIRVAVPAAEEPLQSAVPEVLPPSLGSSYPQHPGRLDWRRALAPASLAGLISALLMMFPLAGFGIGMLLSGVLGVLFYHRKDPFAYLTAGIGARLGALAGAIGFAIFCVFSAVEAFFFGAGGEMREAMMRAIEQSAARNADPQAQQLFEYFKTPEGLSIMVGLGLLFLLVFFMIFTSIGGAVTAAVLRRQQK